MIKCYIGLGSNLENPSSQIDLAVNHLNSASHTRVRQLSAKYLSEPLNP